MATLLYRLGKFAARRAWLVITVWVVTFALAGGAFMLFGGSLTSAIDIPGTPTQQVSDELRDKFPEVSGGTGTFVFTTEDGSELSAEQRTAISDLLKNIEAIDEVTSTRDPFDSEAQLATQRSEIEEGQKEVSAARDKLIAGQSAVDEAQAKLDQSKTQLSTAQQQLDAAITQAEQAGILAQAQASFDQQQATIDQGQATADASQGKIDEQQKQLDESSSELSEQETKLTQGTRLLELTEGIRLVSEDGSTAVVAVQFEQGINTVPEEIKQQVIDLAEASGIDGVLAYASIDIARTIPEIFGPGEAIGVAVAAIALFVMLGTLIGAGLPLISALVGVGIGVLSGLSLSGVVEMISVTPVLGVMLGLAVGIDYSLFILNRHRTQLREGMPIAESIGRANGTSGNAVVFAGATVVIALVALNITGVPFLALMGTFGAICVFVAILIAITLTPALLSLVGARILQKNVRSQVGQLSPRNIPTKPMGTLRAVITVLVAVAVLLVLAVPALSMRLGLPVGSSEPEESSPYKAYKLLDEKFGEGANGPLLAVARLDTAVTADTLLAEQVRIGTALREQDNVVAIAPIGASEDNTILAFQVVPEEGPTSKTTEQLVRDLRGLGIAGVSSVGVAGNLSGNIDVSEKLADALPLYLFVVVGLSLVILVFVFRSILVPITATLGFVLSLFAAFGAITAIFQWGWLAAFFGVHDPGPIVAFLPILVVGILFGLAMDYQLFLVSGMREAYVHGSNARLSVQRGVYAGRTVVIAAAIIMISVFGGFVSSNSVMIQSIGFGLAFGVLIDAFVVRMLLIPAMMHLLGASAWWIPKWLDRILPDIDVEGASLERSEQHQEPEELVETGALPEGADDEAPLPTRRSLRQARRDS